jgi:CelD/BcsL family acetyltransferase involved in cellulose biosynthesis
MQLLGHGPSDYLGPVPGHLDESDGAALAAAMTAVRSRFDFAQLRGWASDEAPRRRLIADLPGRTIDRLYEPCPFIQTTGTWDDFLKARTKKFRANLKRTARRTEQSGAYEIQREAVDARLFEEMIAVERESWKWKDGFAFLRDPKLADFLRSVLLESSVDRELWTLRMAGELAAFALVFPSRRVRHYYLPSFRSRFPDVGSQLLRSIVEDCFSADYEEFDFLQGDEVYKKPWATGSHAVYEVVSGGRAVFGSLAVRSLEARWRLGRSDRLRAWRRRGLLMLQRLGAGRSHGE